jgi:hypothetical protein
VLYPLSYEGPGRRCEQRQGEGIRHPPVGLGALGGFIGPTLTLGDSRRTVWHFVARMEVFHLRGANPDGL